MTQKKNYYNDVITILQELHKSFPSYNMGRHISTVLDEYGDVWGMTDKELAFALTKYKSQLDLDVPHPDESEIDKIVKEGMDLDNILKEEEGDDNGDY
jgi:hypothetical protein